MSIKLARPLTNFATVNETLVKMYRELTARAIGLAPSTWGALDKFRFHQHPELICTSCVNGMMCDSVWIQKCSNAFTLLRALHGGGERQVRFSALKLETNH